MISWKKQISKQLYSLVNVQENFSHKTLFISGVVLRFFFGFSLIASRYFGVFWHQDYPGILGFDMSNVSTFWPSLLFFKMVSDFYFEINHKKLPSHKGLKEKEILVYNAPNLYSQLSNYYV